MTHQCARWFLSNKRRWPLAGVLGLGAWLAVYQCLIGAGMRAAQVRLESSRAAAVALKPPPVPRDENGALIWREAIARLDDLEGEVRYRGTLVGAKIEVFNDAVYLRDLVDELGQRAEAVDLAARALELEAVDWDLDYPLGLFSEDTFFTGPMRVLYSDLLGRAVLAARDGDWDTMLQMEVLPSRIIRHYSADAGVVFRLLLPATAIRDAFECIRRSILAAPALPPVSAVRRLRRWAETLADQLPRVAPVLEESFKLFSAGIDHTAAGGYEAFDLSGFEFSLAAAFSHWPIIAGWNVEVYRETMAKMHPFLEELDRGERQRLPEFSSLAPAESLRTLVAQAGLDLAEGDSFVSRTLPELRADTNATILALAVLEDRVVNERRGFSSTLDTIDVAERFLLDPEANPGERLRYRASDDFLVVWSTSMPHAPELPESLKDVMTRRYPSVVFWLATPSALAELKAETAREEKR